MPPSSLPIYNTLIRTHHITSRKKVAKLRKAASKHASYVLIRSGGSPGIMYAMGDEAGVTEWVAGVQGLRYKDYQCVRKPAILEVSRQKGEESEVSRPTGFEEVESVAAFADKMAGLGLLSWWRTAMGYEGGDEKISGSG